MPTPDLRKALLAIAFKALLALFLIPGLTWGFTHHFKQGTDARYSAEIAKMIAGSDMDAGAKQAATDFYALAPPSSTCASDDPQLAEYRGNVCASYSELWQFVLVEKIAFWTLVGGALLLALMAALGALAFARREVQTVSFVFGWRVLLPASAAVIVLQGLFAVWLSFWLTAYFFEIYIIKLIAIVGIVVAIAIFNAVVAIFRKATMDNRVQGELIGEAQAPALWSRIRDFASRLGTAPPAQLVAGIDANFFVTEHPLQVGAQTTRGRTLFVSLPLLRLLDQHEADAVLAHELGHFVGGDTAQSATLGPKLTQYDFYSEQMRLGGITVIAYFLLGLYRVIFEIALQKSSREREFAADKVAAGLTSPQAIAQSLVKIAGYASYRQQVENGLFAQSRQHRGELGIGQRVAAGLSAFGQSPEFDEVMRGGSVPHPFDSHPPLFERMRSVGHVLPEQQYADVVCAAPASSWTESIAEADAIEQRLWQSFEQDFAQAHEETLAYRYEPANEAEQALVLRYFPPVGFALKKGGALDISYAGFALPDQPELGWDRVKDLKYDDNSVGADLLTIEHPEKGVMGHKSTKIKLAIASKDRDPVKQALGRYWHRHQVMRQQQAVNGLQDASQ